MFFHRQKGNESILTEALLNPCSCSTKQYEGPIRIQCQAHKLLGAGREIWLFSPSHRDPSKCLGGAISHPRQEKKTTNNTKPSIRRDPGFATWVSFLQVGLVYMKRNLKREPLLKGAPQLEAKTTHFDFGCGYFSRVPLSWCCFFGNHTENNHKFWGALKKRTHPYEDTPTFPMRRFRGAGVHVLGSVHPLLAVHIHRELPGGCH